MPHICFVAPNAYPLVARESTVQVVGGAELQQVTLARELAKRNFRVSMICLDFGQPAMTEIDGIAVYKTYETNAGLPVLRFVHPRLTVLWSRLQSVNADVYYTRTASRLTGVVSAFALIHSKKSIFAAADNRDFSRHSSRIRYSRDRAIHAWGVKHASIILVQNDEQIERCRRNFGREAVKIPNIYSKPTRRYNGQKDVVLWVSTIRALKRPDKLIALARLLPKRQFVIVGGSDELEKELFEEVKVAVKNEANIEFKGFVPYSEVDRYFDEARVLVNTSESEGFPNTFLQAWSRAVPTVSFVDCGARMAGQPVGYISTSVEHMAEIVERLFVDSVEHQKAGELGSLYCLKNHSPETVVEEFEGLLFALCNEK